MIGNGVVGSLLERGIDVRATTRHPGLVSEHAVPMFGTFETNATDLGTTLAGYGPGDFVVNCVGLIKQHIRDDDMASRREAIATNAEFPHRLAERAEEQGFRIIHVTTDCVFSGTRGGYLETDVHDAVDVYGRTKSLGEVPSSSVLNLRCSVIGQEIRAFKSLVHWVLSHEDGSSFAGYTDHEWNGLTAPAFGDVVAGILETGNPISGTLHVVPADSVSKCQLSMLILDAFGRGGVSVLPTETGMAVNRVLATSDLAANARLWGDTKYGEAPSIAQMVKDLPNERRVNGVTP